MVKHIQKPTNCLSVFDHFVGLVLKGLMSLFMGILNESHMSMFEEKCVGMPYPDVAACICNPAALET